MKIAVSSQNFRTVTGHAGKTRRWLVYQVDGGGAPGLIEEADRFDLPKDMAMHGFEGDFKDHPLSGVEVVLVGSCGEGFIRRMNSYGLLAAVTTEEDPVNAVRMYLAHGSLPTSSLHDHACGDGCGDDSDCKDHNGDDNEENDDDDDGGCRCNCGCG